MNYHKVYGMTDCAGNRYSQLRGKENEQLGSVACQECGEREDKCPKTYRSYSS